MMRTLGLALASAAFAGVLFFVIVKSKNACIRSKPSVSGQSEFAYRDEIRLLKHRLKKLEYKLASVDCSKVEYLKIVEDSTSVSIPPKEQEPIRPYPIHTHSRVQNPEEKEKQIATHLEQALYQEELDEEWASKTELTVDALFKTHPLLEEAILNAVECRATFCKADIKWSSITSRENVIERLPKEIEIFGNTGFMYVPRDSLQVTFFFSRRGHRIPMPRL